MNDAEELSLAFLCDEDFDNNIMRQLLRRVSLLDIVRVQDMPGLPGKNDATVLEWAAQQNRVVLTHDVNTMTAAAYQRIVDGKPCPGLCVVPRFLAIGTAAEDLILFAECGTANDFAGQVRYLPL